MTRQHIPHPLFRLVVMALLLTAAVLLHAKPPVVEPSYAWSVTQPLGLRVPATIDTLYQNYGQQSIPALGSDAWATTGNLGAEGWNMIYIDRPQYSNFWFRDALTRWLPTASKMRYYNTRIPMTLMAYNFGGGRDNGQDRLSITFSGNINARAQVGALFDYLYSKGSYNNQATKDLTWGFSGSYISPRYEMQAYYNHYNFLNKENGGITDDLYITDPAEVQGGSTKVDYKNIPTRLSHATNRLTGQDLWLNQRYKVGKWVTEPRQEGDSTLRRQFVPVASAIWTLQFEEGKHVFRDNSPAETTEFFENTYINREATYDRTTYYALTNTVGLDMLEGFAKLAKFGLSAYVQHQLRHYQQTPDTFLIDRNDPALMEGYTPLPEGALSVTDNATHHRLWVGGQLTKQRGQLLTYSAEAKFGLVGGVAGDVTLRGRVGTRFPLLTDTVHVDAFADFSNIATNYLLKNYRSNHFWWYLPDIGKERRLRFGGTLTLPRLGTLLTVAAENVQNYVYFGPDAIPVQHSGSIQVFTARLQQNIALGALHWDNRITYQTTSNDEALPLPKLAIYSNLYVQFRVAKVLQVQFGVDCDYYTRYFSPNYQPATMAFYNQREQQVGNYPWMNAYANCKLSKVRFYLMMSHVNQGLIGGNNFFSMPHYPLNPRRFQLGLCVDFAN